MKLVGWLFTFILAVFFTSLMVKNQDPAVAIIVVLMFIVWVISGFTMRSK